MRNGVIWLGTDSPFFSPDGKWITFFANGTLSKIAGGPHFFDVLRRIAP